MTTRGQLSRKKGFKMPENGVKVDRSTKWGNPYIIGKDGTREEVIEKYRKDIAEPTKDKIKAELSGKVLMCWCKESEKCHADVLVKICNE